MSTIVTRSGKGSSLTWTEMDNNLTNLNTDKLESNGALGTPVSGTLTNCTGLPASGVTGTALVSAAIGTTVQAYDANTAKTNTANVWTADQTIGAGKKLIFEGTTDDSFEGTLTCTDPTVDRTWTLPDKDGTIAMTSDITSPIFTTSYDSGNQTISGGGTFTLTHGLGAKPKLVTFYVKCLTSEMNYTVGDEIQLSGPGGIIFAGAGSSSCGGFISVANSTSIYIRFGNALTNPILALDKTTGALGGLTNANWAFIVRAYV